MAIARTLLSLVLGALFVFIGLNKAFPLNPDMTKEFAAKVPGWLSVFPPTKAALLPAPAAIQFQGFIGGVEVMAGALSVLSVLVGSASLGKYAALGLAVVMAGAVYTHFALGELAQAEASAPSAVFLALLLLRVTMGGSRTAKAHTD